MYAVPVLLTLVALIALVYLPRIRKPALWLAVSIGALGALGGGGVWIYGRVQDRRVTKEHDHEISLVVDHAIGRPPHCKFKPFTERSDGPAEDRLYRAQERAWPRPPKRELTDEEIIALAKPYAEAAPDEYADLIAAAKAILERNKRTSAAKQSRLDSLLAESQGSGRGLTYEQLVAMGGVPVKTPPPPPGFKPDRPGENGGPTGAAFNPDEFLCSSEVREMATFIKEKNWALNEFIAAHPNDSRVAAVQTALDANGEEFKKTCKDLVDEGRDEYELHQQGCK
jgi:hypothetical protein